MEKKILAPEPAAGWSKNAPFLAEKWDFFDHPALCLGRKWANPHFAISLDRVLRVQRGRSLRIRKNLTFYRDLLANCPKQRNPFFCEKKAFFWRFLENFGNLKNRTGCKIPPSLFVCETKRTKAHLLKSPKKRDGDPILLWDSPASFIFLSQK